MTFPEAPRGGTEPLGTGASPNEFAGTVVQAYETWPITEAEARVSALFMPSPELVAEQRPKLWSVVNTALAATVNPHDRRSIVLTGRILDWQLFTPAGPLPEGMVLSCDQNERPFVSFDTREWFVDLCSIAALRKLGPLGLDDILAAMSGDIAAREGLIRNAMRDVIREMPEHTLARAFDMRLPENPGEQPIPDSVRAVREEQIRQDARQTYRLQPYDSLRTNAKAQQTVRRGLQHLDDETIPHPETTGDASAIERARAHFLPRIRDVLMQNEQLTLEAFVVHNDVVCLKVAESDTPITADTVFTVLAENLAAELSAEPVPLPRLDAREIFASHFLEKVFDTRLSGSYGAILDMAVESATRQILEITFRTLGQFTYNEDDEVSSQLRHRMAGPFVDRVILDECASGHSQCAFYEASLPPGFSTREKYERMSQRIVGRRMHGSPDSCKGRIIQAQPHIGDLPWYAEHEDLRLALWSAEFGVHADPYVPGYRLVSRSGHEYGFVREDHDPYAPVRIMLTDSQRDAAAVQARSIGMTGFAQAIAAEPGLTLERLRELLEQNTYHVLPDEGDDLPRRFNADTIGDFASLVDEKGFMVQQCSVSFSFQRLFLEGIFGKGTTTGISGYVVGPDGEISAVKHGQVIFALQGNGLCILDASPPFPGSTRQSVEPPQAFAPPPPAYMLQLDDLNAVPTLPPQPQYGVTETHQQRTAAVYNRLEMSLRIFFREYDSEVLRQRVAALPEHDLVRRTVEFARSMVEGKAAERDIRRMQTYVRLYRAATAEDLRLAGLAEYETGVLDDIESAIRQFAAEGTGMPEPGGAGPEAALGERGISIEALDCAVGAVLTSLPYIELSIARDGAARALARLRTAMAGSAAADDLLDQLHLSVEAAALILDHISRTTQEVKQYRQSIL